MKYKFQWNLITRNWDTLVEGLLVTYQVAVLAILLASVLGLILALMRLSPRRWLSFFAQAYIELGRTLPLYVFLLWIYFGLAVAVGITLKSFQAGVLALGLISAAYMAEIYRAGIMAVDKGQFEAARALGLNGLQIYGDVVLPQAFRIILPAAGNQFVGIFKGAAIVSVIGVADLMFQTRELSLKFFRPFEFYTTAGAMLIGSTLIFAALVALVERRLGWGR
ncbi:MAG: glutamine ABC transporter permease [Chloroflexota bacterium]|nr:MAG: glutamine ABC transporter permease [Chloroflexota bacterium]